MSAEPPTATTITRGALRMRRYRDRQRDNRTLLSIELRASEIDALIRRGFLDAEHRRNLNDIASAL